MKSLIVGVAAFFVKSRTVMLCILAVSLLLNLVLFLRIPFKTKPDVVQRYSEETVAVFKAVPNKRQHEWRTVPSREVNALFNTERVEKIKSMVSAHQIERTIHALQTHTTHTKPVHTQSPKIRISTAQTSTTQLEFASTAPFEPSTQNSTKQSACPEMTIHQGDPPLHNTVCRPHQPTEDACKYTAEIFELQRSIEECHDQKEPPFEMCRISEIRFTTPEVECDVSACLKTENIQLFIVHPSDGNYLALDLPGIISNFEIETAIKEAIKKTQNNGFNFLFINCVGKKHRARISQLLTFLPHANIFKPKSKGFQNKVNVNVVLLDSISRPHFYRSLRKTVAYLREKSLDSRFPAHLFDFELFQSVHGHTHENEHALFDGTLYPENFTKSDRENAPTNMERLFGIFKDSGYQTMAQNDLCWKAWYGFLMSFMTGNWSELQKKMRTVIDSTGITDASCKILQRSNRKTSFTDYGAHQICYNGKHHHSYLFDYLTNYLTAVTTSDNSKPLFSYTETNTAHDDVGIRVQTLDQDLVNLIDKLARFPNTFTIIYADHGNTYTDYQVSMLEGRLEMYHPVMLGILPKELGRKFGKGIVENLRTNQYRLVHLFDIRESLVELANYNSRLRLKPVGIFQEISKNRTCDDLKLSTPNYCICEGWDSPVANSTAQVALAEFAIGQLNNQLQSSLLAKREGMPAGLFGACQRLRFESIKNVRQRQEAKGTIVTTIDVKVQSGNIVDQEELITVQVEWAQKVDSNSFEMRLMTYNRVSHYAIYEQCADSGVPVNLCICNLKTSNTTHQSSTIQDIISKSSNIRLLKPCLSLIKRVYSENRGEDDYVGVEVYELANTCDNMRYSIKFKADAENVRSSTNLPFLVELQPQSIYFAAVMMTEVGYMDTSLKLHLRIVEDDLKDSSEKPSGNIKNKKRWRKTLLRTWLRTNQKTKLAKWKQPSNDDGH